jgi:hypothetical protein
MDQSQGAGSLDPATVTALTPAWFSFDMIFTITRTGAVRFQLIANTATAPCFAELAKHLRHDNGDRPAFPTLHGHPVHRGEMSPT